MSFSLSGNCFLLTPWKINMEHINHPFREENDLANLHDYVQNVNLPWVYLAAISRWKQKKLGKGTIGSN